MKYIANNWIHILMFMAISLCLWAIFSIPLKIMPLINTNWEQNTCDSVNSVYLNLSYSFLAGFFFYILTIILPSYNKSRKMKPVLKHKADLIQKLLDDMVLEFSRGIVGKNKEIREELYQILDSKSWTDILTFHKEIYGSSIRYIDMISGQSKVVRSRVIEFIDLYKEDLSEIQIKSLEDFIEMQIFKSACLFSSFQRVNLDDPNGKKELIDTFCDMYYEYKRIVSTF